MNENQNQANMCQRVTNHSQIYRYSQGGRIWWLSKLKLIALQSLDDMLKTVSEPVMHVLHFIPHIYLSKVGILSLRNMLHESIINPASDSVGVYKNDRLVCLNHFCQAEFKPLLDS